MWPAETPGATRRTVGSTTGNTNHVAISFFCSGRAKAECLQVHQLYTLGLLCEERTASLQVCANYLAR